VEHSRSTVRKGFEIVSWVVSKYPLSIVVKSICLSMSSDHCLKGFKLRNESTSTDHKIILDHVRSYLIPGVASFIPDSAMQGTAGMEIKLDNEPARNHISGIIELHIRTANDKYKSSEPEYLPPPLPEQHSHADHHLASKDANGTHHLHVETGDAHPVVSFHPEPATVRTSSPATGELKHILPMRCACTRKSGMCAAPMTRLSTIQSIVTGFAVGRHGPTRPVSLLLSKSPPGFKSHLVCCNSLVTRKVM
jgi:hypothetical protein